MAAISYHRGHKIVLRNGVWVHAGTGIRVDFTIARQCKHCKREIYGHEADPCLGTLPGVTDACCGHGDPERAYVKFTNGVILRGFVTTKV